MAGKKGRSGGARPNSGPKTNGEREEIRRLIDAAVTEADWIAMLKNMVQIAKKPDSRLASACLDYLTRNRFGVPGQPTEITGELRIINMKG